MSSRDYSASERGGGLGDTGRRRAAILNQINAWMNGARWEDPERAERIQTKMNEAPERFISPDPDADYREEASRVYHDIKEEYGLRTVSDAVEEFRDLEARAAERYAGEQAPVAEPELGGAPEPNDHNPSAIAAANGPTANAEPVDAEPSTEPTAQASLGDVSTTRAPEPAPTGLLAGLLARVPEPVRSFAVGAVAVGDDAPIHRLRAA